MKNTITKEPIKILPYHEVDFKFVSLHYDIHLMGSCMYENELCLFTTEENDWDEEKKEWKELFVKIYKLNLTEKFKWIWTQWIFEQCVGHHWSYKRGERCSNFYYRKPQWFYKLICKIYYKTTKSI